MHSTAPGTARKTTRTKYTNTNVFRFYQAYHKHSNAADFYVAGVGTRFDLVGKIVGGVFGLGELPRINEAYDHLCAAWAAGDHTIDVVGFSRGAATTLDFCQRIQSDGIRRPDSDEVLEPNPQIRFWVSGTSSPRSAWPISARTDLNIGHHLSLPKSSLKFCFHAMALDERRPSFLQTRLHGANEVWFRGVHSDVGGGNTNRGPERHRAEVDDEQGQGRRTADRRRGHRRAAPGSDGIAASGPQIAAQRAPHLRGRSCSLHGVALRRLDQPHRRHAS